MSRWGDCKACGRPLAAHNRSGYCQVCRRKRFCMACCRVFPYATSAGLCHGCTVLVRCLNRISRSFRPPCPAERADRAALVNEYRHRVEQLLPTGSKYLIPAGEVDVREEAVSERHRKRQ